ncbi:MAG TPA: hypothetical protein VH593_09965 [Ktedonobacteraceae bacterium]
MARKKSRLVLLASALIVVIYTIVIYAQSSQANRPNQPPAAQAEGPVIDYAGPDSPDKTDSSLTGTERDRRHAKSGTYDRAGSLPIKEDPNMWPVNLSSHWWLHLPALPVAQSDTIVVGSVTGSHAFLSNDKHVVYSEFYLQVEQMLKDGTQNINLGDVITTTRYGGIVRFPSGRKYVYRLSRQAWPATGSRYVLFLRRNQSGDFDILTGYEIRNGEAEPLDGSDKGHPLQFQKYAGTPEAAFLEEIRTTILNSTAGEHP